MGIKYDLYKNPSASKGRGKMHARVISPQTTDTAALIKQIEYASSLTEGDVTSALSSLVRIMRDELEQGNRVHLKGLGYFYLTLRCPPVDSPKKIRAESIKVKTLAFRPEITLRKHLAGTAGLQRVSLKNHSQILSDVDVDRILTDYFNENTFLTRQKFQALCGYTDSTAARRLKMLVENGTLRKSIHSPRLYELGKKE